MSHQIHRKRVRHIVFSGLGTTSSRHTGLLMRRERLYKPYDHHHKCFDRSGPLKQLLRPLYRCLSHQRILGQQAPHPEYNTREGQVAHKEGATPSSAPDIVAFTPETSPIKSITRTPAIWPAQRKITGERRSFSLNRLPGFTPSEVRTPEEGGSQAGESQAGETIVPSIEIADDADGGPGSLVTEGPRQAQLTGPTVSNKRAASTGSTASSKPDESRGIQESPGNKAMRAMAKNSQNCHT